MASGLLGVIHEEKPQTVKKKSKSHLLLPGLILDVIYESLIANQERESRRMIKFAGFSWEDDGLNFHHNPRAVQAASARQVRQPIYNASIQRWKRYEKHLTVLQQALAGEQI